MYQQYDILECLSQRKDGEMPPENERLVQVANDIRRIVLGRKDHQGKAPDSSGDVTDSEKRAAELWSKQHGCWIPFCDIFDLGFPGPSGSVESAGRNFMRYLVVSRKLRQSFTTGKVVLCYE